ncbi:hypothetical protein CXB51_028919 [Gossypium anomalum]|uniref:Retrovirus-related Pol polyprotein from transposon TNT 1-94 n=1 Tax=Gossypium anomalum TaxID=47600 RepID=A0A8J6CL68_9ROSI|nr:hypothetical protein CXB51_028919 [Gossypium anomalum]
MSLLKYEIPLLDRNTRFALWQIKMQTVLVQMNLEYASPGIDKMPSTLTDKENKHKDRKALTQLHLHLFNEILQDVMKEKTAAALWKRLKQLCISKTLTSKLHMKQRLYVHHLEEDASVHKHLTVFKEILSDLEAMEFQFDKEDLWLILLCSLPPSYSTFRDMIFYSRESLTVDEIYDSLTSYDKMKHLVEQNPRGKSKERSKSSNREDYSDDELLVASVNNSKVRDEWIIDSGVGTIKDKMFDGVVKTLSNMRHVSELKRNLIWLSTFDSKGYKYTTESRVLKIFKGSLVVMKVQRKTIKLYVFQGSTITGDADVASSFLSDDDITRLWHMHLGNMSENNMTELSKRGLLDGQGICKLKFCKYYVFGKKKRV